VQNALSVRFLNTGLVALAPGDTAYFHVSLDDLRSSQPATVRLQFFDETGRLASSDDTVIHAGQSTTLQISGPGLFRAHAELLESSLGFSGRRTVVGTLEVFDSRAQKLPTSCTIYDIPNSTGGGAQ
jgi:hypothetical protein